MSAIQKAALTVNALGLLAGGLLAGDAILRTLALWGEESLHHALSRGLAGVVLLLLTISYVWLLRRNGFRILSVLLYPVTYLVLAVVIDLCVTGMAKNFAPASPEEVRVSWAISIGMLVALAAAAVWSVRAQAHNHSLQARRP